MADEPRGTITLMERFTYTTAAARTSDTTLFNQDIGKIGFQSDVGTYWRLGGLPSYWSPWFSNLVQSLEIYKELGSPLLALPPMGGYEQINNNNSMSSGDMLLHAVYLPYPATITGVKWHQWTAGAYTAASLNNTIGLYSYSAGTLTQVAVSVDNNNLWAATSNTIASVAFSSTYSAQAGLYFIMTLYRNSAQTTQPLLGAATLSTQGAPNSGDFTNSAKLYGFMTSQTVLPASIAISSFGTMAQRPWLALY